MFTVTTSSQFKPSVKTVQQIVQQLECKCLRNDDLDICKKTYLKLESGCVGDSDCQKVVDSARRLFCRKNKERAAQLCRNRVPRLYQNDPYPYGGQQQIPQPTVASLTTLSRTEPPLTNKPPTPPPPEPLPPLPSPPVPTPETETSSSSTSTLLIVAFIFGILFCIGISAVAGYLYYKKQEQTKEEERKKIEQSRQMEKRKKRKMRKKKSKRIIVQQVTGEETRVERRDAKDKDREEEEHKWKAFDEANRRENTFLDP